MFQIGGQPIQSFDDGTVEAQAGFFIYPTARKSELSSYPWHFATLNTLVDPLASPPTDPLWDFEFAKPTNCIRVQTVTDAEGRNTKWLDTGRSIKCNRSPIRIEYVADVAEIDMPAYFENLLVCRLAWQMSRPLLGDETTTARLFNEYVEMRRDARRADAQQNVYNSPANAQTSGWTRARRAHR